MKKLGVLALILAAVSGCSSLNQSLPECRGKAVPINTTVPESRA